MMADIPWGQYPRAYKAIHSKLDEILAKLDNETDPQTVEIIKSIALKNVGFAKNRQNLVNGDFEWGLIGWDDYDGVQIDDTKNYPQLVGHQSLKFTKNNAYAYQAITPPLASRFIQNLTFFIMSSTAGLTVRAHFFYANGSYSWKDFTTASAGWEGCTFRPQAEQTVVGVSFKGQTIGFGKAWLDWVNLNTDPVIPTKLEDLTWSGIGAVENPLADTAIYGYTPSSGKIFRVYGMRLTTQDATTNMATIYIGGAWYDLWVWNQDLQQLIIGHSPLYSFTGDGTTAFEIHNMNAGTGWYVASILYEEV